MLRRVSARACVCFILYERIRANHSEFMALMEEIAGGSLASGYIGGSDFYNVIGRSNDYSVVVCGIGIQNHGRYCLKNCG